MDAISDAMNRFAEPLIDATDGSPEELQRALMLSSVCWNLALTPEESRDEFLAQMQPAFKMDDEEFQELKRTIFAPMIQRHQEMFPGMNRLEPMAPSRIVPRDENPPPAPRRLVKKYAGTGRNSLCPCGSGKKYKLCCGTSSTFVA
jgi:SEC-C motif